MPSLSSLRQSNSILPTSSPYVIAIIGGTTGIGSYTARAFARLFASRPTHLRVYLVGRNESRADDILAFARKVCPGSDFRFIKSGNAALLSECERIAGEIKRQEEEEPFHGADGKARLDAVYVSHALSPVVKSPETLEGLDTQMSLLYYSRIHLAQLLTPLLLLSSHPTAHIISIFAGSMEDSNKPSKPPIGCPEPSKYGVTSVRNHVAFMKALSFERLAGDNSGKIAYTHIYPGLVDSPAFTDPSQPFWFRTIWPVARVLLAWYITAPNDCGDVMISLMTDRYPAKGVTVEDRQQVCYSSNKEKGGGCYSVGQRGDGNGKVSYEMFRGKGLEEKVWEHTMGVLDAVGRKNTERATTELMG